MRVVRTRRYLRELGAIGDYIAERDPRAAARIVREIDGRAAVLLARNSFIGRNGEIPGTRELVIPNTPYVVAYRVSDTHVEVLFVQHGAREWPSSL